MREEEGEVSIPGPSSVPYIRVRPRVSSLHDRSRKGRARHRRRKRTHLELTFGAVSRYYAPVFFVLVYVTQRSIRAVNAPYGRRVPVT